MNGKYVRIFSRKLIKCDNVPTTSRSIFHVFCQKYSKPKIFGQRISKSNLHESTIYVFFENISF